jgi:hypothetical protein
MPGAQAAARGFAVVWLAVLLSACMFHGPVGHADLLLTIRNDTTQPVTVRWKSTGLFGSANLAFVDAGAKTTNGLDAGTYTLSVDGGTATARLTVARSTRDPEASLLVVNRDLSLTLP